MINTKPLDYSKPENWIINEKDKTNTKYDLIYFCGTSIIEPSQENGVGDDFESLRKLGYCSYKMCGEQLAEDARVFCPIQRQISLKYAIAQYKTHRGILEDIASKEPYIDLKACLDYYFEHYNKDCKRPFVLAGHSQGSAAMQVLLVYYFLATDKKKYLKNMIAAYGLGYAVSKKHFLKVTNNEEIIHFATGADDYNCVISWNSEGDGEKGYSFLLADEEYDSLVINPLNWKRDETYASIKENLGVILTAGEILKGNLTYKLSTDPKDLADAKLDLKRGCVIVTTKTDYIKHPKGGEVWGGKSLHGCDGRGFYNNMKQNLKVRVNNFFKDRNK